MESENLIKLPLSGSSSENEDDAVHDSGCGPMLGDSLRENSKVREDGENARIHDNIGDINQEDEQPSLVFGFDEDMDISPPRSQFNVDLTETVSATKIDSLSSKRKAVNGFATVNGSKCLDNSKEDALIYSTQERNESVLSGAKRPRMTSNEKQPCLRVIFNSLARESRQKLVELLQQWSEWHSRHCSSTNDTIEVLESGEQIYFPAIDVGGAGGKALLLPFWMDNPSSNTPNKEFIPLEGSSISLYDRAFSFALSSDVGPSNLESNLDVLNTSRCFNCSAYNHSLRECPKPRDSMAVNNARKQHKSRRSQNNGSHNLTSYYQSSPRGKYDGLRPGVLDAETRQLLGLGELDPPPWLSRMRDIGYPPGYLDAEARDQPSGITIFSDEGKSHVTEDGKILEGDYSEPHKKMSPEPPRNMSVEFPGVNAPIPKNADLRLWEAGSSNLNFSGNHYHRRLDVSADSFSRRHYYGSNDGHGDYQDVAPPGTDFWSSSYRYGAYGSSYTSYSPTSNSSGRPSPNYGRSLSERSRRSPLAHDGQWQTQDLKHGYSLYRK